MRSCGQGKQPLLWGLQVCQIHMTQAKRGHEQRPLTGHGGRSQQHNTPRPVLGMEKPHPFPGDEVQYERRAALFAPALAAVNQQGDKPQTKPGFHTFVCLLFQSAIYTECIVVSSKTLYRNRYLQN